MSLRATARQLRLAALAAPAGLFADARRRHPALAPYPTLADVLAALADDRDQTYPERDAITQALLAEHRTSRHSLWSSVLVVAYLPMLHGLRRRLHSDFIPPDELNQIVLTAFLDALNEPYRDRVAMRLRQRTTRAVFATLRSDLPADDAPAHIDDNAPIDTRPSDLARLMNRAAQKGVSHAGLEVVENTVLRGEFLRKHVERVGPSDKRERERMYQRLKRRRSRALHQLRSLLGQSPDDDSRGF